MDKLYMDPSKAPHGSTNVNSSNTSYALGSKSRNDADKEDLTTESDTPSEIIIANNIILAFLPNWPPRSQLKPSQNHAQTHEQTLANSRPPLSADFKFLLSPQNTPPPPEEDIFYDANTGDPNL
ncbi:hypothetical protein EW146_g1822 [Bondarzewia mesenterica]|uniref:Uncharacterized protein n=1 Tax=Bondarzewia mesenterica TaxID=1095465 RepID=A0A4S4M2N8_9AGAM|nr:hypothetical protein EW146_g1822 [Bondarzewia mesenterica]